MKNRIATLFFVACATAVLSSCNKATELLKIDISAEHSDVEFTIPVITATGNQQFAAFAVRLNVDSLIKRHNGGSGSTLINKVILKSCVLTLTNGDAGNNFANLQSCSARLSSDVKPAPVMIAEVTNNPDVQALTLDLPVTSSVDLKDYFNATNFSYVLSGNARRTTNKPLICKATIRYTITVQLPGE